MRQTISRRDVLATGVASATILTAGSTAAFARCGKDHKKMGYRLGALMVDPTLTSAKKAQILANAKCPDCGTAIEPDGMSYGEHMR